MALAYTYRVSIIGAYNMSIIASPSLNDVDCTEYRTYVRIISRILESAVASLYLIFRDGQGNLDFTAVRH